MNPDDPTLATLGRAALGDPQARGPLADWFEEHGHPEAAALARFGKIAPALIASGLWRPVGTRIDADWPERWKAVGGFLIESHADPADFKLCGYGAGSARATYRYYLIRADRRDHGPVAGLPCRTFGGPGGR
jgi:hypothetical protein